MRNLIASLLIVLGLFSTSLAQTKTDIANPTSAFGNLLVDQLSPIMQQSFEYTVTNTDLNKNTVVNGGTVTQSQGMAVLGTSTTTSSTALFQSKQHGRYRGGQGAKSEFTGLFPDCDDGIQALIGIADEVGSSAAFKNGFFIGCDAGIFGFHRYQNDVRFSSSIHSWDKPLVSGSGNMTLIQGNLNIYFIQFQYLGAGAINVKIENEKTGRLDAVHQIDYANKNTVPSVFNPNFHHTMWVSNGATTTDVVIKSGSYGFFIEGSTTLIHTHRPIHSTGFVEKTAVTTEIAILTIRNRATYFSITNSIDLLLEGVTITTSASAANSTAKCRIVKNTTLGGTPSYSDVNTTNSVLEFDVAGTTLTGGDEILPFGLAGKEADIHVDLTSHQLILNPEDTLTVACLASSSSTINAALAVKDLF